VPVPDSGNCAALGYSLESGIPFEMAFVRNHYIGRSFLQPTQLIRDFNVRVKLNLIPALVKNQRVIVIDDSIVRGTTCKARVTQLKEAGAKGVHVMVSCPHMNPCVYGIDFPDRNKLMAANYSINEIQKYLNADSLATCRLMDWCEPPVCRRLPSAWLVSTAIILSRTIPLWKSTLWSAAVPAWKAWAKRSPKKRSRPNCSKP
jgi:glutamine phosphoribosylpyrophosphate amidotransferase